MTPKQQELALYYRQCANDYAKGVLDGTVVANKWVKLAVKRNENDLKNAHKRDLYFDEYAAARILVFFSYLKHYKGEWRGKRVLLEPWQCWIISVVFGWKRKNGKRRFREVYEEVARKNGKTIKLAGIGGFMLLMDGEGAPEIYAAATTREQSKRAWRDARKMLGYAPTVSGKLKFKDSESHIECPSNDGFFIPLSRDAESVDGSNPHFGLVDELHAHKTAEIYDVLISGMGARSQPIIWAITTAGAHRPKEESICLQKREYATKVLEGSYKDDEFFGIIYTLDAGDDFADPKNWVKANPNIEYQTGKDRDGNPIMSGSVKYDYLAGQVTKAKNSSVMRYGVLTKNFNIWSSNAVSWANMDVWDKCGIGFDIESLRGAEVVYGGLDLASVSDLASLSLLAIMPDGEKRLWSRSWIPEERIIPAVQERGLPYDQWVKDGWLMATPGSRINYEYIQAYLVGVDLEDGTRKQGLFEMLPIELIGADEWGMGVFFQNLAEETKSKFIGVRQGYKTMSPAMKEFDRLYSSGELVHENNPVLRWAMSNVVCVVDPAENIKPDKKKSAEKIDPVVASINAIAVSIDLPEEEEDDAPQIFVY